MGKHKSASEYEELIAAVATDSDEYTRAYMSAHEEYNRRLIKVDDFIEQFAAYLRDSFNYSYRDSETVHILDAASTALTAAENFYSVTENFPR